MSKKENVAFLLSKDQKEIIDELTNEEAGIIFKAIYEYEITKKEPKLDKILKIVFKQFKIKLDFYDIAYEEKCLKNKENADKRWQKYKNANECDRMQSNAMDTNKREREREIEIKREKKERENKRERVVANATTPTLDEIISYSNELGFDNKEYCKKFFNHYESIGWVNGTGQKIKNWKLIFNNWVGKDKLEQKVEQKRYL